MKVPRPVTIGNDYVTLKPLSPTEAEAYFEIGRDAGIWQYLAPEPFRSVEDAARWIDTMGRRSEQAGDLTFSVYDAISGDLAGSSSYLEVRTNHSALEVGFTWYGKAFQRTHVNTATKLALFDHAFESLSANRVQLQTDARNLASQRAIERVGATREGVLRNHKVYPDGYVRDSVIYSVVVDEWPKVKRLLEGLLNSRRSRRP